MISNEICPNVQTENYKFDISRTFAISLCAASIDLEIRQPVEYYWYKSRDRFEQTKQHLDILKESLQPCEHTQWLLNRGITEDIAHSIDYSIFSDQQLLDLWIKPADYILDNFNPNPVIGPAFLDIRDGELIGVCIRNISKDLEYAAASKYTISNYGWYLFGYDECESNDEVYLVEGVFDVIVMRRFGYKAIGLASSYPTAIQIGCLLHKFKNINICFDNDFWGHVGAHMANKISRFPIFMPKLKDIGCYATESKLEIDPIDPKKLEISLAAEIEEYNSTAKFTRPLPYNK